LITAGYLKDPTVPTWQDDPGFKEWVAFATKYMSPMDVREGMAVYGFTTAATMVHVLEQCGDDLSRENILRQAIAIKDLELPMLLPGVKINTSPDSYFLIRQMQLAGALWRIDQRLSRRKFGHHKVEGELGGHPCIGDVLVGDLSDAKRLARQCRMTASRRHETSPPCLKCANSGHSCAGPSRT
jgi:hypothetical protein